MTDGDGGAVELRDAPGQPPAAGALAECAATAAARPASAGGGIRVTVEIANHGAAAVRLANPLDFLAAGVLLMDGSGRLVDLPPVAPRLLSGSSTDGGRLELPFRLEGVESGGRALSDREVQGAALTLDAGARLRIALAVDRTASAEDGSGAVPLPAGAYQVEVTVTLVSADHPGTSRILRSPAIAVDVA